MEKSLMGVTRVLGNRPTACVIRLLAGLALACISRASTPSTVVRDDGILRWAESGAEVVQFGVNYTTPFAYAYRAHKRLGIPLERAIDADVYHFARLGLDAYRVHIWDREISDPDGNLVVNDHVRVFDYLLAQLEKRGIKIILTGMQFGNAGYPDVGEPLNGFSSRFGKKGCLEDKTSWPLQERYLSQLVRHVNAYTGVAYKDDPDIIAFEICNEPGHTDYRLTVDYINSMVKALRDAGYPNPIFYNMSHGMPVVQAYLDADIQGATFQWYPSNLVAGHEQRGNFLPYVDDYPIPFADNPKFRAKAKMVYEFDCADIGRSYLYPAIARTFRKAGVQFATQFAYDPLYLAPYNTEYRTHFMNLAYAPQKALSLMIAGEAFRRVPLFKDYGTYPNNARFEGVRVSYEQDLAELATETKLLYTNDTKTVPPAVGRLTQIAGYGSSPVVRYPGLGAYFLDRLEPGVWRLEVMPDAVWTHDPFEKSSLEKQVSRIAWNEWPMRIDLPDLGVDFRAVGLDEGNRYAGGANDREFYVRPGVYLLTRNGVRSSWKADSHWHNITLGEFVAPPASLDRTYVLHTPLASATAGQDLHVSATIASPDPVRKVELVAYPPGDPDAASDGERPTPLAQPGKGNGPGTGTGDPGGVRIIPMNATTQLRYEANIPAADLHPGTLEYHIVVEGSHGVTTFPSRVRAAPTDWDFYGRPWICRVLPQHSPILLFDAEADAAQLTTDHRDVRYGFVPSDQPGTSALRVVARHLGEGEHDVSFRSFFADRIAGRRPDLAAMSHLVLYGKSGTNEPCPIQVALLTSDGAAYGAVMILANEFGPVSIPLSRLQPVPSPNIPHGYPVFIHYWSDVSRGTSFQIDRIESVLVSIGPAILPESRADPHTLVVERIGLE